MFRLSLPFYMEYTSNRVKNRTSSCYIYEALHDLVPFVQFKKREKHPWRSITFSKVTSVYSVAKSSACNFTKNNTLPWGFLMFFKLHEWYHIVQSVSHIYSANGFACITAPIILTSSKGR